MQFVSFKGNRVAYYLRGDLQAGKLPLVLLHGLCEDSSIWNEFVAEMPEQTVLCIDLSGFGKSDVLPTPSVTAMAESVKAVLNALHIKKCVLIGHSLGGYVAMAFAGAYPELLAGLGMFHSHPFADSEEKKEQRRKAITFIKRNGHIVYVKQLIPSLFADLFVTSNAFLMNSLIYNATQYKAEAIISAHEAMINRADLSEVMRNLTCPVLIIIGKQDKTVPYELSLAQVALPKVADVHILPKVAHMGMFTAKEKTVKIVRNFVSFCTLK